MPISAVYTGEPMNGTSGDDYMIAYGATTGTDNNTVNANEGDDLVLGDSSNLWLLDSAYLNDSIANAYIIDSSSVWSTSENEMFGDWTIPHATVIAEATLGQSEYYAVTVGAGETLTVDIDFGANWGIGNPRDLVVEIRDGSDTLLTFNDDSSTSNGGQGSISGLDSYLTFTAPSAGTYYINVHPFGASTFNANKTYDMNVSGTGHAADS